jgi:hypothetical protein
MPPAARSVAWQAAGSAATLGAALWVSWRFGLAAQGEFGFAKSWFDAAAVIGAIGLPQGLLHLQYRCGVAAAALLRWLARGLSALALASLAAAALLLWLQLPLPAAVAASLPFAVGHLLARSLLLAGRGVVVFGVVTALPALLLLGGVLLYDGLGRNAGFEVLLLGAAVIAGSTSLFVAWRSSGPPTADPWPRAALWQVSLQSGLQAALGGALAAALLSVVAWRGHGGEELGAASLGWHLYQLFAVAAGYVAPLIFDRLARQERPSSPRWPAPARAVVIALLLLAAAALAVGVAVPRYAVWLLPLAVMLPAGLASVAARVAGTVLLARAAYVELSLQAAARLVIAVAVTALALHWLPAATALALALLVIELTTWWRCVQCVREPVR